jgi:hypothetical protein
VGPSAGVDVLKKRKISCPCRESNPGSCSPHSSRFHPFYRTRSPLGRVKVQRYSVLDLGTKGGEGSASRPGPHSTPGKDQVPTVQEAGWAPEPVWTGAENLAPTGIRSPDLPARSQLL